MRTAIYVYQPTTITFGPSAAPVAKVVRYGDKSPTFAAEGQVAVQPGIYFLQAKEPPTISGAHLSSDFTISEKDAWPDPPQQAQALEQGATLADIRLFFQISKDVEL